MLAPLDLARQLEFYFSDDNLLLDDHMASLVRAAAPPPPTLLARTLPPLMSSTDASATFDASSRSSSASTATLPPDRSPGAAVAISDLLLFRKLAGQTLASVQQAVLGSPLLVLSADELRVGLVTAACEGVATAELLAAIGRRTLHVEAWAAAAAPAGQGAGSWGGAAGLLQSAVLRRVTHTTLIRAGAHGGKPTGDALVVFADDAEADAARRAIVAGGGRAAFKSQWVAASKQARGRRRAAASSGTGRFARDAGGDRSPPTTPLVLLRVDGIGAAAVDRDVMATLQMVGPVAALDLCVARGTAVVRFSSVAVTVFAGQMLARERPRLGGSELRPRLMGGAEARNYWQTREFRVGSGGVGGGCTGGGVADGADGAGRRRNDAPGRNASAVQVDSDSTGGDRGDGCNGARGKKRGRSVDAIGSEGVGMSSMATGAGERERASGIRQTEKGTLVDKVEHMTQHTAEPVGVKVEAAQTIMGTTRSSAEGGRTMPPLGTMEAPLSRKRGRSGQSSDDREEGHSADTVTAEAAGASGAAAAAVVCNVGGGGGGHGGADGASMGEGAQGNASRDETQLDRPSDDANDTDGPGRKRPRRKAEDCTRSSSSDPPG